MQHLKCWLVKENKSHLFHSEVLPNKEHTLPPLNAAETTEADAQNPKIKTELPTEAPKQFDVREEEF